MAKMYEYLKRYQWVLAVYVAGYMTRLILNWL